MRMCQNMQCSLVAEHKACKPVKVQEHTVHDSVRSNLSSSKAQLHLLGPEVKQESG